MAEAPRAATAEAEALWKKLGDGQISEGERYAAAVALAEFGPMFRTEAASVLRKLTGNPESAYRWEAVASLARLGPRHREQAAAALRRVIHDTRAGIADRRSAAAVLGNLGGALYQAEAKAALRDVVIDGRIHADPREAALQALAGRKLTRQGKARVLLQVIEDRHADLAHRRAAATLLGQVGPAYHAPAAEALKRMAEDHRAAADDRGEAIIALASLRLYGPGAADALRGVILTAEPGVRCRAAEALAGLGREHREEAAAALREVMAEAGTDPFVGRSAAQMLGLLSEEHRDEAVAALLEMAAGDAAERREPIEALRSLVREGGKYENQEAEAAGRRHRARSGKILRRLLADAGVSEADRQHAALAVQGLDATYRGLVAEALTEILLDESVEAGAPQDTAAWLVAVALQHLELAVPVLRATMVDQRAPAPIRRKAAEGLASLEGSNGIAHFDAAAGALRSLLLDEQVDPAERREAARSLAYLVTLKAGSEYFYAALRAVIVDPSTASAARRWAVEALMELPRHRDDLADALRIVVENDDLDAEARQAASELLTGLAHLMNEQDQEASASALPLVERLRRSLGRR